MKQRIIIKENDINEGIQRVFREIVGKNRSMEEVVLVGIGIGGT